MAYTQDKDTLFKWALGALASICIAIQFNISNQMTKLIEVTGDSKKDIEYIKIKNIEQDAMLSKHETMLFVKPEETKIKNVQ
jgi:hypothetical protein